MVQSSTKWHKMFLPEDLQIVLSLAPNVVMPKDKKELIELALGGHGADTFEVKYDVKGRGIVPEAQVIRCKNGIAVNYFDPYMRRRDPETMVIADEGPTDKTKFNKRFSNDFKTFRKDVLDWLGQQELVLLPFYAGGQKFGYSSLLIAPLNASFFAAALADLQGMIPPEQVPDDFSPKAIVYLAPPFRHTHCQGKQIVVHNRDEALHEVFALNLYPGPSAKKGIYGVLLSLGEKEGWVTVHGSTVQVITPYDNEIVIMHEGASGGGKSEMLQYPHREPDGRLLLGRNVINGEKRFLSLIQGCTLRPVTDDMALCHPGLQKNKQKLVVTDAEEGWFVRVNHITHYGVDAYLENMCISPKEPLSFLNLYAVPNATCLIWEHIEDKPGVPCPNPRVILPRRIVPAVVNKPVEVDLRSFGVRTPPCTRQHPSYGILGILHLLPPALAWLWRMVSPRGHANPSVTESAEMSSEGVGSYWPFATGRKVDQANLLLRQIMNTPKTRYCLVPNQYIGAWEVGFMAQWLAREYLSRKGVAQFKPEQLRASRCSLLGSALYSMQIEGVVMPHEFLQVEMQTDVGVEAYDRGAQILTNFFHKELAPYLKEHDLDDLARRTIECCLDGGKLEDYEKLIVF